MSDPRDGPREPASEPPPEPRTTALAGGCVYTVLLLGSIAWLGVRDRLGAVPAAALGDHGAPLALGAGLLVGLAGFAVFALILRRLRAFGPLEDHVRQIFGAMGESPALALVLIGAVAEEMFFRMAVQDQFGLVGSVATYTLVSTAAMGLRWMPVAALHATALGGLMALGFGLLATTAANAVMTHLTLRRMLNP